MTIQAPEVVDLTEYTFTQGCVMGCGRDAAVIAKGCMDKEAVYLCDRCFTRGLDLVRLVVRMYQKLNRKILVCDDCHRPIITLETHIDVRRL